MHFDCKFNNAYSPSTGQQTLYANAVFFYTSPAFFASE